MFRNLRSQDRRKHQEPASQSKPQHMHPYLPRAPLDWLSTVVLFLWFFPFTLYLLPIISDHNSIVGFLCMLETHQWLAIILRMEFIIVLENSQRPACSALAYFSHWLSSHCPASQSLVPLTSPPLFFQCSYLSSTFLLKDGFLCSWSASSCSLYRCSYSITHFSAYQFLQFVFL